MGLKLVNSSAIKALDYSPETKQLTVHFHGGSIYHYEGVSNELYKQLENAESVGAFLHRHVKGKHPHKKADPKRST